MNNRRSRWFWGGVVAILAVVVALYVRTSGYGPLPNYDDGYHILNRTAVQQWWEIGWWHRLATPEIGYPIPIPTFIWATVREAFPDSYPGVLHGLNLLVHGLNVVLAALLVRRWLGPRAAVAVAAIWALHPAHVETVAWLTNLKTLLWGTGMLAVLLVWDWRMDGEPVGWRRVACDAAVFAGFLVALGCRPDAVLLPCLLVAAIFVREREAGLRDIWPVAGATIAVSATYLPMAMRGHNERVAGADLAGFSVFETLRRFAAAFAINLRNLVWPLDLQPVYHLRTLGPGGSLVGAVAIVSCLVIGIALALRRDRRLLALLAASAVCYLPYAQLVPVPRLAADTYLYLPSLMVLTALGLVAHRAVQRVRRREIWGRRGTAGAVAAGMVVLLASTAWLTDRQIPRWRDAAALFEPMLDEQPPVWKPYAVVAHDRMNRGAWGEAAEILDEAGPALEISKYYPAFGIRVYEEAGRLDRAADYAVRALLAHRRPPKHHARLYLSVLARHRLKLPDAPPVARATRRAVDIYTDNTDWMARGDNRMALAHYFARSPYPGLAVPFLQYELQTDAPDCAVWSLVDRHEASVELPSKPARCRSDAAPANQ
jgi:tetratricopeptide (TPR) repeat protein